MHKRAASHTSHAVLITHNKTAECAVQTVKSLWKRTTSEHYWHTEPHNWSMDSHQCSCWWEETYTHHYLSLPVRWILNGLTCRLLAGRWRKGGVGRLCTTTATTVPEHSLVSRKGITREEAPWTANTASAYFIETDRGILRKNRIHLRATGNEQSNQQSLDQAEFQGLLTDLI